MQRRQKLMRYLVLVLAALVVAAACGDGDGDDEAGPADPAEDAGGEDADTDDGEAGDTDGSAALGDLSGQLAVATYGGPTEAAWQDVFGQPFSEEASDVDLAIQGVSNPSALAFAQEGDQQFDLLLVTGANVAQIRQTGEQLYRPIDPGRLERADMVYEDLVVTDDDGNWVAVPVFITFYGIVYNTDMVEEGAITSWADFADPQYDGEIMVNSPFFFATTDLPMFSLANGGDVTDLEPGFELLEEVLRNNPTTMGNLAESASMMAGGEVAVAPFYFSQYSQLVDQDAPVDMVLPEEGGLLSPLYLILVDETENEDAAYGFLDFVLDAERQEAASDRASYVPVVEDADLIEKISERSGFASTEELMDRLVIPDWDYLAENQGENSQRIEDMIAE
jgi:spermidine/putrescine-binding protein